MGDDAKLVLAKSLDAARVGEAVLLDVHGNVQPPAKQRRTTLAMFAFAVVAWGWIFVTMGVSWMALGVLGAALALGQWVAAPARRLQKAIALAAARRDEEAEAVLTRRSWRGSFAIVRLQAELQLANIAWRRGDQPRALQLLDGVIAATRGGARWRAMIAWLARCSRARLLVIMGRAGDVAAGELDGAPDGEWFAGARRDLALARAFHAEDPASLPDDGTLHDWARVALSRSQYDCALGYLAWAFDARGDAGMAEHLIAEAQERQLEAPEKEDPRLREWLAARAAPA